MKRKVSILLVVALVLSVGAMVGAQMSSATTTCGPVTGAIWTTDTSETVNRNLYDSKDEVYLNGGPKKDGAAGLPDGDYYIQVTDPSGSVILGRSLETTEVVDGEFVNLIQLADFLYTTSSGYTDKGYDNTPNPGGVYKVWVSKDPTFRSRCTKTDNFKVGTGSQPGSISGMKFYDTSLDGIYDGPTANPAEVPIPLWRIELWNQDETEMLDCTLTDIDGEYRFRIFAPGTYVVKEVMPNASWINWTSLEQPVTVAEGQQVEDIDFGNVCLGVSDGRTLGFWSNKQGQATMNDGNTMNEEFALLNGLSLVKHAKNGTSSYITFNGSNRYGDFRSWLLNAESTNMAYMLSAQLATMALNVEANSTRPGEFVSGSSYVSADCLINFAARLGSRLVISADGDKAFISINDLMEAATTSLQSNKHTVAQNNDRAYQEALKNVLDKANMNESTYVQPGPCAFTPISCDSE